MLLFLPFLGDFNQVGRYSWVVAWFYRKLCRASNEQSLKTDESLTLLQVWVYDRFIVATPQVALRFLVDRLKSLLLFYF